VDAACSGNPGPVEYQCVHTSTRKKIFKMGPLPGGSCNIGEFLALVHVLALLARKGIDAPVYSDSMNGISWVRQKKCKTCVERTETNAQLFALIDRAEQWLASHEYENRVLKWDTKNWGEIPADYGRK
jgi:ribonuclease HI